jgi:hypothetical protein
LCAASDEQ